MQKNKELYVFSLVYLLLWLLFSACTGRNGLAQQPPETASGIDTLATTSLPAVTGAERMAEYLPLLQNKRVAMVVNHTSVVGKRHLVDTLLSLGIQVKKVFAPEHGFRGTADAGEHIVNETDRSTGLPLISLYGSNKKPTTEQLKDVDIVVFDIQDVGVRFYTYISTMHYVMEACAEQRKPLLVLDRPNPNGWYTDGPVLDMRYTSFVGMHPIPIVHGLTVAELAQMINGEGWLANKLQCELYIVACQEYSHSSRYSLPIKPSPNLPNDRSIELYPSLCLFEGTVVSVGRGTDSPFQIAGHPGYKEDDAFEFTPVPTAGATNPPHKNILCRGIDYRQQKAGNYHFTLEPLLHFYRTSTDKKNFFNTFFVKLAGTDSLRKMIEEGKSEEDIRASWQPELEHYRLMRKKYLLYND